MVSTDRKTDFAIDLEATRGREKAEAGWFERVGWGKDDPAVVDAVGEGRRRWWASEGEVPFIEVGFQWCSGKIGRGVGGQLGGLFEYAFYCW